MYNLFFSQGHAALSEARKPNQILLCVGLFMLMLTVLQWAYTGTIRTMLTRPGLNRKPIDTIEDMINAIKNDGFWWATGSHREFYWTVKNELTPHHAELKILTNLESQTEEKDLNNRTTEQFLLLSRYTGAAAFLRAIRKDGHFMVTFAAEDFTPHSHFVVYHQSKSSLGEQSLTVGIS